MNPGSQCDVLVVGAGPAGSSVARAAASEGARVLVVDRRRVIGVPVQCAEYVPAMLRLREGPACTAATVQSVRGMRTYLCGEPAGDLDAPGYMIDRDRFDRALAGAAERAGAQVLNATEALRFVGGTVVLRRQGGGTFTLQPKIIVGADGPRSTVARWAGIVSPTLIPAVQARVRLSSPMDVTEVYLDPGFRAGYAWLFPKGEHANAGVGYMPVRGARSLGTALKSLLEWLASRGRVKGRVIAHSAGWIPVGSPSTVLQGNLILVGDAAGHAHPVTGAGVFNAVAGGRIAGTWAARAALSDDLRLLDRYEEQWRDLMGDEMARAAGKRHCMETHWDRFDDIIRSCWIAFREYYA